MHRRPSQPSGRRNRRAWVLLVATWLLSQPALAELADAESLLRRGDVPAALEEVKAHVAAQPKDVAGHELLIDILHAMGLGRQAAQHYRQLAQLDADDPQAHYLVGRAALTPDEAEAAYRKAIALQADHPRGHMGLAAVHRSRGDLREAEAAYDLALAGDPSLGEAWAGAIQVLSQLGRQSEATAKARAAMEAVPDVPEPYLFFARLRPIEARTTLSRGIEAVPDEPRLHLALARALVEAEEFTGARDAYDAALALSAGDVNVRMERGVIDEIVQRRLSQPAGVALLQLRLGARDPKASLTVLDKIVADHGRSVWARLARGNLLADLGRREAARKDLSEALSLAPDSVDVHASLGLVLLAQGAHDEALEHLGIAQRARSGDAALALAHATALTEVEGNAAGVVALRQVVAKFPYEPGAAMALGRLLTESGNAPEAYHMLKSAAERIPDPQLLLAFSEAAERMDRDEEAAQALEIVSKLTGQRRYAESAEALRGE